MKVSLSTNISASLANRSLSKADIAVRHSINRLSTGRRINKSTDDVGGLSVTYALRNKLSKNREISTNLSNSLSFLDVQQGALRSVGNILSRMTALKTMSLDVMKNGNDLEAYNEEFKELQLELGHISKYKFNGISIFSDQIPKILFGESQGLEIMKQVTDDENFTQTANITRWGILRFLSTNLESGDKPPDRFEDIPAKEIISMVFTNESLSNEVTPSNNDTSEPRRSYHEHWFGGYNPSRPLGEDWEDQFWIEDRDDWIGYLGETNFSAKIGVIANNTAALIPDHYSGGGIISESTKLEIANDGVVIDFFQDNSSGGDGLKLLNEGGSAASQLANFQRAFLKMTSNGTEIPTAVVLNVDNSSSMGGFGQLNEGVLAFKDWIKNTYPSIYMPEQTSGNFQAYLDSGGNGVDIPTNENGYFMGIRINEGEDYIRQGRLAIEDAAKEYEDETGKPLDGTLDDSSNGIKSLLDSTYDLDEFDMSEFQGFLEKLSTAMGTNGAETEAIKQRLKDLQNTYQSTELAHAKVDSVDIAKESTKFAKRSVLLQATASILLQANQINDVALSLLS